MIQPKDIHFLAPFTPFTERQLKAIANNEEFYPQIGLNNNQLDIVDEIKVFLQNREISTEELAEFSYIQKSRLNTIIHRDIQPTFNDILKLCACGEFVKLDGSRYNLTDFFTDDELRENFD